MAMLSGSPSPFLLTEGSGGGGGASRASAAMGSSTLLPTITASLRGEFVPLLRTLENVNSFTGATYMIEIVLALVRFDAFLTREERHLFVRAFNALITSIQKERQRLDEMRRQLEESRDYLAGLVERCGVLEEMAEAKAREEALRHCGGVGGLLLDTGSVGQISGLALGYPNAMQSARGAGADQTALPSMQNSFSATTTTTINNNSISPGGFSLSFTTNTNNRSMTDKQTVLQQAFRSSLRRRVEHGITQGSWTVPANLSELSSTAANDCLTRENPSFAAAAVTGRSGVSSGSLAPGGGGGDGGAGASSVAARPLRRRLSGSCLPPLLPPSGGGSSNIAGAPQRTQAQQQQQQQQTALLLRREGDGSSGQRGSGSLPPYYPSQQQQQVFREVSNYSIGGSPSEPVATTMEGLCESSFWSLLNGANAPADVELLYGLLTATTKLTMPSPSPAGGGHHGKHAKHAHGGHSEGKQRGGLPTGNAASNSNAAYSSASRHAVTEEGHHQASNTGRRQLGANRQAGRPSAHAPSPTMSSAVLAAISKGAASPVHWHTWFAMLAVLSVLTEGFFFGGITAEEVAAAEAQQRCQEEGEEGGGQRQPRRRLMRHGDDDDGDGVEDDIPATPAVSLISDASGDGNRLSSALREPSPEALSLLKRVYCPSLRNFKVGIDNVATAAPVLAARAAGPQPPTSPNGTTRMGNTNTAVTSSFASGTGIGGDDAPFDSSSVLSPPQLHSQLRRLDHNKSMTDLTGSLAADGFQESSAYSINNNAAASFTPDSFAFPVEAGILSEGSETTIRPVDVVLHALVTALEVQMEVAAAAAAELNEEGESSRESSGENKSGEEAGGGGDDVGHPHDQTATLDDNADMGPSTTSSNHGQQQQQQQQRQGRPSPTRHSVPNMSFASVLSEGGPATSSALITTLLQKSFSSVAAARGSSHANTAAAGAAGGAAGIASPFAPSRTCGGGDGEEEEEDREVNERATTSEHVLLSLPAIMKAELVMILDDVSASLDTVASMSEQLKSEASLLIFRVVSTVLDWLIPAVYLVSHRVWLFYRAWICDLYALLHKEGLMGHFTAILDQEGNDSAESHHNVQTEQLRNDNEDDDDDGARLPAEPPTSPISAMGTAAATTPPPQAGRVDRTAAALQIHATRRRGTAHSSSSHPEKGKHKRRPSTRPSTAKPNNANSRKNPTAGGDGASAASAAKKAGETVEDSAKGTFNEHPIMTTTTAATATADNDDDDDDDDDDESDHHSSERSGSQQSDSEVASELDLEREEDEEEAGEEKGRLACDGAESRIGGAGGYSATASSRSASPPSWRADPFALVLPGCNVHIIAMVGSSNNNKNGADHTMSREVSHTVNGAAGSSDPASPQLGTGGESGYGGGDAQERSFPPPPRQAVIITRGTLTGGDGPGVSFRRIAAHISPTLQLQQLQRESLQKELILRQQQHPQKQQRAKLQLLSEVSAPVRAAQALLDEGTYIPMPQHFLVTPLVAATVRGMDPDAVRSLLTPFICCTPAHNHGSAAAAITAGAKSRNATTVANTMHEGGGTTVLRSTTMSPTGPGPIGFPVTPTGADPTLPGDGAHLGRHGAVTPGPRHGSDGESTTTLLPRSATVSVLKAGPDSLRAPLGEIVPAAASTIDNQKPASNLLTARQQQQQHQQTGVATAAAAHWERPALAHHHRFRYPIVEGINDVGQLYMNTLHEAEGMLSPHDPLRAALVQSVVDFYLNEMQDPLRAITVLEDYLDDVGEECVQMPDVQPATVLGDGVLAFTNASSSSWAAAAGRGTRRGGGATPQPPQVPSITTTAFSVTSVRRSQQKQLPTTSAVASGKSAISQLANAADASSASSGTLPLVPMVIPSWGTKEEEEQFGRILGTLRSLQEVLRAQYMSSA